MYIGVVTYHLESSSDVLIMIVGIIYIVKSHKAWLWMFCRRGIQTLLGSWANASTPNVVQLVQWMNNIGENLRDQDANPKGHFR